MNRYLFTLLFLSFALLNACDGGTRRILGEFSFWHAGLESTGNIVFRSQGIIDTTFYVVDYWNDDRIIVAKGYWYQASPKDEVGEPLYFIIDMKEYAKEPIQLRSKAVVGPFSSDSSEQYLIDYIIKKPKSLSKFLE